MIGRTLDDEPCDVAAFGDVALGIVVKIAQTAALDVPLFGSVTSSEDAPEKTAATKDVSSEAHECVSSSHAASPERTTAPLPARRLRLLLFRASD